MSTEVLKAEEFGLTETQVEKIEQAFVPKKIELQGFQEAYSQLIKSEITPELCKQAGEFRKKLVKVRTGTDAIHKVEKQYYLQAGKFIDARRNSIKVQVEQMEATLSEIENYYEIKKQKEIESIRVKRWEELSKYTPLEPKGLGEMDEIIFKGILKVAKEEKEKVEQEEAERRKEAEEISRKESLRRYRRDQALPYFDFWSEYEKTLDFAEVSETDFNNFLERVQKEKIKKDSEIEQLKRQQAEAEAKSKKEQEDAELLEQGSDKEKIRLLFNQIKAIKIPEFKSKQGKQIGELSSKSIAELTAKIIEISKTIK